MTSLEHLLWWLLAVAALWQAAVFFRERYRMQWLEKLDPIKAWLAETGTRAAKQAGTKAQEKFVEVAGTLGVAGIIGAVTALGIGSATLTLNADLRAAFVQWAFPGQVEPAKTDDSESPIWDAMQPERMSPVNIRISSTDPSGAAVEPFYGDDPSDALILQDDMEAYDCVWPPSVDNVGACSVGPYTSHGGYWSLPAGTEYRTEVGDNGINPPGPVGRDGTGQAWNFRFVLRDSTTAGINVTHVMAGNGQSFDNPADKNELAAEDTIAHDHFFAQFWIRPDDGWDPASHDASGLKGIIMHHNWEDARRTDPDGVVNGTPIRRHQLGIYTGARNEDCTSGSIAYSTWLVGGRAALRADTLESPQQVCDGAVWAGRPGDNVGAIWDGDDPDAPSSPWGDGVADGNWHRVTIEMKSGEFLVGGGYQKIWLDGTLVWDDSSHPDLFYPPPTTFEFFGNYTDNNVAGRENGHVHFDDITLWKR